MVDRYVIYVFLIKCYLLTGSSCWSNIDLANARSNEKIKAQKKLLTLKPVTNQSARYMIRTLMTNRNPPKVKMVIGRVRITKIGFTIKFNTDSDKATRIALT